MVLTVRVGGCLEAPLYKYHLVILPISIYQAHTLRLNQCFQWNVPIAATKSLQLPRSPPCL